MKFILGYKQAMTQRYREDGTLVPVTVVKAEPAIVTQVKTAEKEGYTAIQLGIGTRHHVGKSGAGHIKPILEKGRKPFHVLREIRVENPEAFKVGDTVAVSTFTAGDTIHATGTTKGKGFQGVVKRHGFSGSPASHGHKDQLRMPGSIGSQDPQHVFKGTRMAGRTGGDQVTVKNLEVVDVDAENNLLYVKGALPGARNGLILLQGEGEVALSPNMLEAAPTVAEKANEEPAASDESTEETTEATEEKSTEEAPTEQQAEQTTEEKTS